MTSCYKLRADIYVDDYITSHILKTYMIGLLPKHRRDNYCNCTQKCSWRALERDDTAYDWAIRIYEKLKTDLEAKKLESWWQIPQRQTLLDCSECRVERGCCKKRTLMLAMTSQIITWLKQHQEDLGDIEFGDDPPEQEKTLVYIRQDLELHNASTE